MEDLELRLLKEKDEQAYLNFIEEFIKAGEKVIPANAFSNGLTFLKWLNKTRNISKGSNLPAGWVPSTVYFLFRKGEDKIIGAIDIRHKLNGHLLKAGGNIGYGIASSERRKGYACELLKMALKICKEMRMKKVLITCNHDNVGSYRTIIKNGGILEGEFTNDEGIVKKRFWIYL